MALLYHLTHVHLEHGARKLVAGECERVGIQKSRDGVAEGVGRIRCGTAWAV